MQGKEYILTIHHDLGQKWSDYLAFMWGEGLLEIVVFVLDTLRKYAEKEGLVKIEGYIIRLTEKGLDECQKSSSDWD